MVTSALQAVRLYRMDLPDHACPWGLRAVKLLQERHIPFEDHRLTSTAEVEAFKAAHGVATTPQIFAGEERIGGYSDLAVRLGVRPEGADISYTPVVVVFLTAGLMALVLAAGVSGFMGFAICLLAMPARGPGSAAATSGHRLGPAGGRCGCSARRDVDGVNCACVGGNSKTPLGVVSFAENLIMAAIGAAMLAGR